MTSKVPQGETNRRAEGAIERLRARGGRVTKARRALITVLAESDDHLRAEDIADQLASIEPGTHRATIYRTLESLVQAEIVAHVHLPHGATTYHLVDDAAPTHLHLLCRECGQIIDAPSDLLDEVRERLATSADFRLDPDHVALTGWCPGCIPAGGADG